MIRACPFGEVMSADVAWSHVTDPSKLDSWWTRGQSVEPAGPMAVGQHIEARAMDFRVTLDVLEVDAPTRHGAVVRPPAARHDERHDAGDSPGAGPLRDRVRLRLPGSRPWRGGWSK